MPGCCPKTMQGVRVRERRHVRIASPMLIASMRLAAEDDQAKAEVGAQAAPKLASDDEVAAVVGTLNSSVAQQVQPILDRADIAMVSPANTNPTLTHGDKPEKKRQYESYFRVA